MESFGVTSLHTNVSKESALGFSVESRSHSIISVSDQLEKLSERTAMFVRRCTWRRWSRRSFVKKRSAWRPITGRKNWKSYILRSRCLTRRINPSKCLILRRGSHNIHSLWTTWATTSASDISVLQCITMLYWKMFSQLTAYLKKLALSVLLF